MGRDGIAGLATLAGSVALYWATLSIESNPLVPVSPAFYPRLVFALTGLLSAMLVASDVLARRAARRAVRGAVPERAPARHYGMVALLFAIFAAYVLFLPYAGFRVATFGFMVFMQLALDPARDARRWIAVLVVALATMLVAYYTFEQYLQVLLPRGEWTGL
ncbi:MAG TPA: tripartite tricarboxylate transporter TctB family protein [Usitatibacter sp.]|nr:tripartite tricarboxylate transporter TctB family protein [Usitatibacter sp.]